MPFGSGQWARATEGNGPANGKLYNWKTAVIISTVVVSEVNAHWLSMAWRRMLGIQTHLFVNEPINPTKCRNTIISTQLGEFACNQQPDKETERPAPPSWSHPQLRVPCLSSITYGALFLPQVLVGVVEIQGGRTETPLGSPPVLAYSFGWTKKIKEPGQKSQKCHGWQSFWRRGCGRRSEISHSLSTGNPARTTPGFSWFPVKNFFLRATADQITTHFSGTSFI